MKRRLFFRRWPGRFGLLFLIVTGLSSTATCSQSPPPGPTPDLEATVRAVVASVVPASTPLPTPDVRATVQAAVMATTEAAPAPTPLPTPDVWATVQAMVRATVEATSTPTPIPTPDVQATVQAIVKATVEAVPTPTAVPIATARPVSRLPPVFPVDPTTVVPAGTQLQDPQEIRVPNGHGGVAPWRDGGGQRIFSMWVYGTIYQIDQVRCCSAPTSA